jgi:hypothetical protein
VQGDEWLNDISHDVICIQARFLAEYLDDVLTLAMIAMLATFFFVYIPDVGADLIFPLRSGWVPASLEDRLLLDLCPLVLASAQ